MRNITEAIKNDLEKKLVLLSGPRQVGKTTLAQSLFNEFTYLNYDSLDDRALLLKKNWNLDGPLILDEIHKHHKWKLWLKGLYDTKRLPKHTLITGSAKMNTFRRAGDSLAGRFFHHTLFPIDVKEGLKLLPDHSSKEILDRIMLVSGFPEPFFSGEVTDYRRWRASHLDVILKQDILELEHLRNITKVQNLFMFLPGKVGNLLSYTSLTEDLSVEDKTVRNWIDILENSYLVFRILPYGQGPSSIKKMPKLYLYDFPRIEDEAYRFENCVALSLLKEITFLNEVKGLDFELRFMRNKQKQEIDFVILNEKKVTHLIEVKLSDTTPSENFKTFAHKHPKAEQIQVVYNCHKAFHHPFGVKIIPGHEFLAMQNFLI